MKEEKRKEEEKRKKEDHQENKKKEKRQLTDEEQKAIQELEEELMSLLKDNDMNKNKSLRMFFNIGLHPNFLIHSLLVILINGLTLSAVMGLTGWGVINDIGFYLGSIVIFSILESFIKVLVFKLIPNILIRSLGMINLIYLAPLFYLVIGLIGKVSFAQFWQGIIVFVFFLILRNFFTHYVKKISYGGR